MDVVREEPLEHVAYLYDGSIEGLLSAVFESYASHEVPEDIVEEGDWQPRLLQSVRHIDTDMARARRVRAGINRAAGNRAFSAIVRASLSEDPDKGIKVLRFIRYVMDKNSGRNPRLSVLSDLSNPVVGDVIALSNRVTNEAEKMRQFVRFTKRANGVWFSHCNPNASVVPLVMPHFVARFNIQPFAIYDEVHHIAGVYNGRDWQLVRGDIGIVPERASDDSYVEALWQRFYDSLSIDARYNPELRRHFMPVRLWKNLPEMAARPQGLSHAML